MVFRHPARDYIGLPRLQLLGWDRGGGHLWQKSEAQSLQLRLGPEKQRVAWHVSVLDGEGELMGFWGFDAETGEPISK